MRTVQWKPKSHQGKCNPRLRKPSELKRSFTLFLSLRKLYFFAACILVVSLFSQFLATPSLTFHGFSPFTHIDPFYAVFPGPLDISASSVQDNVGLPNVFHGCGNASSHVDGIQLHVFGWKRVKPLKRLLSQIRDADYAGWKRNIPLFLHIDGEHSSEVASIVNSFDWPHGSKIVDKKDKRLGLREMWLSSLGIASSKAGNNTLLVALEDDVIVSRSYFQWLLTVIDKYARNLRCRDSRLVGFSLSPVVYQEMFYPYHSWNVQNLMGDLQHGAYLFAVPSSWGAAYWSDHWQEFDKFARIRMSQPFYDLSREVSPSYLNIPNGASSNNWPKSWKRFMVDFMYGRGLVMLYPNFSNQNGLATALQEDGEHAISDFFGSINPVVSKLVEHYSIVEERELPRYGHLIVVGLDHKKTSKERLAGLGTKFLIDIANNCRNCRSLLSVWAYNDWWQVRERNNQPFICVADLYTSTMSMSMKPKVNYDRDEETFLLFDSQLGISNQLLAIGKAYGWAQAAGRTLVLPPFISAHQNESDAKESESQGITFKTFFQISHGFENQSRPSFLPSLGYGKDPISFMEFQRKNKLPWRMIRATQQAISDRLSIRLTAGLDTDQLERVNLRHIFDRPSVSARMVQHLFGACDDAVLVLDGILSMEELVVDPWDILLLPDLLKVNPEISLLISAIKAKLQLELGSNDYSCCKARQSDFVVTCNRSKHSEWKSTYGPYLRPLMNVEAMCSITPENLSRILHQNGPPLLLLSDSSSVKKHEIFSEIPIKRVTSTWVSNKLRESSDLHGSDFELLSQLTEQQLCAEAKLAVM